MNSKKQRNKWSTGLALMLAISLTGVTIAVSTAHADESNPYTEGTSKVRLSPEEKASLLQYADNSKSRLENALEQASGKSFEEANTIYLSTIKDVVVKSYASAGRSELLMRYTLNQALELTFGTPNANGGAGSRGVLQSISNPDLLTVILEDSIHLALGFYQDDRTAIQSGTLADLPYMSQALQELALARKWQASITEPTLQYALQVAALQHFMNSAANEDQMHQALYAEELTHVDDLLSQYTVQAPADPSVLMQDVRVLRGEIRRLQDSAAQKLQAEGVRAPSGGGVSSVTSNIGTFIRISHGTFLMGSPSSESGRYDDENQHQVTISRDFEMQATDVTQAQYVAVMGTNPSYFQDAKYCPNDHKDQPVSMCPNNPVEQVSYDDVQTFLQHMNGKDGYTYRLPTEAEWEYAARAGTQTAYSFGDKAAALNDYAWYSDNSNSQTHPVGTKKANPWGLYDMQGNVWQWVQDFYASSYPSGPVTDPLSTTGSNRVIRGGSWSSGARDLRSASRFYDVAGIRYDDLGFRLVRTR